MISTGRGTSVGPTKQSKRARKRARAKEHARLSWTSALLAFKIHFGDRLPE
jgi:hypothetical protein